MNASERRIWRALVVQETGVATWDQYLRETSRADDGRDPVANGGD